MRSKLLTLFSSGVVLPPIVQTGLVAEYRFDDGSGQALTDYGSSGWDLQLGSTSGADTNDPTWVTAGLQFATDDYCYRTTGPTVSQPTTHVIVANHNPTDETALYLFDGGTDPGRQVAYHNDAGATEDELNVWAGAFIVPHGTGTFKRGWKVHTFIFNGASSKYYDSNSQILSGNAGAGGLEGLTVCAKYDFGQIMDVATVGYHAVYNTALDTDEIAENVTALTTIMAARGVTIT